MDRFMVLSVHSNHMSGAIWDAGGPTFSLIFLTWNSEQYIERTLRSVFDQTVCDFEVVVVDNDSADETVAIVEQEFVPEGNVRVIENDANLGFTRGINRGIEAARGDYICCYNDDTYFPEKYLRTLENTVTRDAVWTTARRNHRVSTEHATVRLLSRQRFPVPYIVDPLSGVAPVNFVPGDGLIVPRSIYSEKLRGTIFDPEMPNKGEDLDLSLRLRNSGVPMRAVLDTYSVHPDEGFYEPTLENGLNHLRNVYARARAYEKNGFGPLVLLSVAASAVTVPLQIYLLAFPRSADSFLERTTPAEINSTGTR